MTDSAINILTNLSAVDPTTYLQAEAYIQRILTESFPDRDFTVGRGLYWMVVVPAAAVAAAQLANARLTSDSLNLGAVRENPELVNDELADLLLSNYYVSRRQGSVSSGTASIVVNRLATYVLAVDTLLQAGDDQYRIPSTIYVYPTASQVVGPNDRLLQPRADGTWQFTVPVEALEEGPNTTLPRGAAMALVNPPPGYVRAVAATDISGGVAEQSLADLLATVPQKFAASTWGGRNTVRGLITELYPQANVWTTGFGDPEMLRDKHNPLAVASGGFSDVWVSTQNALTQETRTYEAQLVDVPSRTWRITLDRQQAAGVYTLTDVRRQGSDLQLIINQIQRGYVQDLAPGAPLIFDAVEAAFSAYQTLVIDFQDVRQDLDNPTVGQLAEYDVGVLSMADIQPLTDTLVSGQYLNPVTNVLVRGVVPCQVSVSMVINLLDADYESAIDTQGMRGAIIDRVSNIALGYGVLSASIVLDAVHDYLSGRSDVGATTVTIQGRIYAPNGEQMYLGGGSEIRVPDQPEKQVTRRTTKFFIDRQSIDIQFQRVDI